MIKLDMELIRNVDQSHVRQSIVATMLKLADTLDILVVAEGVETAGEFACLKTMGVILMQGYYLARPALSALPSVDPAIFARSRSDAA